MCECAPNAPGMAGEARAGTSTGCTRPCRKLETPRAARTKRSAPTAMAEAMQFNPGSAAPAGLDKSLDELIKESKQNKPAPKPKGGPAGKKAAGKVHLNDLTVDSYA